MTKPSKADIRKALETTFAILSDPEEGTGLDVRDIRGVESPFGIVYAGTDRDGHWHVLLPTAEDEVATDRASRGIQVVPRTLIDDGEERVFVDLVCRIPRLRRLFVLIAVDLLVQISPQTPVSEVTLQALDDWRELLARASRPVTESRLVGLIGELWQLRELVGLDPRAVVAWRGPDGEAHDLEHGGIAIEVKTRLKRTGQVTINGLTQLEAPDGGRLALAVMTFERASEGTGLTDLLRELEALGASGPDLLDRVAKLGVDPDEESVRDARFALRDEHFYEVADGFPRLTRRSLVGGRLDPAVTLGSYTIDLMQVQRFLMAQPAVAGLRREMVEH